jgi:protein Mpv17
MQVAADQFIAAPCLVGLFFTAMPILEGKPEEIQERLAAVSKQHNSIPTRSQPNVLVALQKWQPTLIKNWSLFIPVQMANLSIVPFDYWSSTWCRKCHHSLTVRTRTDTCVMATT